MLADEGNCAGGKGACPSGLVVVHADDDDGASWFDAQQLGGGADAVVAGHVNVHEHNVRVRVRHCGESRPAITGFADDPEVGLHLEAHPQAAPHVRLVVDEE